MPPQGVPGASGGGFSSFEILISARREGGFRKVIFGDGFRVRGVKK